MNRVLMTEDMFFIYWKWDTFFAFLGLFIGFLFVETKTRVWWLWNDDYWFQSNSGEPFICVCQSDAVLRLEQPSGLERQHGDRQQLRAALPLLLPERLSHLGKLLRQRLLRGSDPRLARLQCGELLRLPLRSLNKRSVEQKALNCRLCCGWPGFDPILLQASI